MAWATDRHGMDDEFRLGADGHVHSSSSTSLATRGGVRTPAQYPLLLEAEEEVLVEIKSVAGETLTTLLLPMSATVRTLKRHLQETHSTPVATQKLVHQTRLLSDSVALAGLAMQPSRSVTLTLVVVAYNSEMGVPLLNAAEDGDLRSAERALQALADPNHTDADGWTPLHMASLNGHVDVVRMLSAACADQERRAQDGGACCLHMASWSGHVEVVRLLCESGVDLNRLQTNGWTALQIASRNGFLDVVQLLCKARVDMDQKLVDGRTAWHIALFNGHLNVVRYIQQHGQEARQLRQSQLRVWFIAILRRLSCSRRFARDTAVKGGQ